MACFQKDVNRRTSPMDLLKHMWLKHELGNCDQVDNVDQVGDIISSSRPIKPKQTEEETPTVRIGRDPRQDEEELRNLLMKSHKISRMSIRDYSAEVNSLLKDLASPNANGFDY